jgi:hypothetical protein
MKGFVFLLVFAAVTESDTGENIISKRTIYVIFVTFMPEVQRFVLQNRCYGNSTLLYGTKPTFQQAKCRWHMFYFSLPEHMSECTLLCVK